MFFIYSIFKYWKFVLILGLSGVLGFGLWQLERKNTQIHKLQLDNQEYEFYLESLEDAVSMQNDMIDTMAEKNKEFEVRLENAQKKIFVIRETEVRRIENIVESDTGNSCESNMDFLLQQAQDEHKWAD